MSLRVKGWCPSLYRPMASGDGLIARIKPPGGRLTVAQTMLLAELARRHGNGRMELTIRANWQLRGLGEASLAPVIAAAVAAGLAHDRPAVEAIRNVICHPLGAGRLAPRLETALAETPDLAALPGKFGFVVEDGATALGPVPGDIRLIARAGQSAVALDGSALAAPTDDPVAAALALARLFLRRRQGARRMRELVARSGAEALFAEAGLAAAPWPEAPAALAPIGPLAGGAFALGLPFGQIAADRLIACARALAAHGDGWLRLSPWRSLVVAGLAPDGAARLQAELGQEVIVAPGDPRLQVVACTGAPLCAGGRFDSRALATRLAARGTGPLVHVSGCAKGCAHPAAAALTLVGTAGGIDLIRGGRAGDPPAVRDLDADQALVSARP